MQLPLIDMGHLSTDPDLSRQVFKAITEIGFFYVVNHGYTAEQVSILSLPYHVRLSDYMH